MKESLLQQQLTTLTTTLVQRFFSLFQHANFENETCVHKQGCVIDQSSRTKAPLELPASYTNVQPLVESKMDVSFPKADHFFQSDFSSKILIRHYKRFG